MTYLEAMSDILARLEMGLDLVTGHNIVMKDFPPEFEKATLIVSASYVRSPSEVDLHCELLSKEWGVTFEEDMAFVGKYGGRHAHSRARGAAIAVVKSEIAEYKARTKPESPK